MRAVPRRGLGYAMVVSAAGLFGVHGSISKVLLGSGLSVFQLTQVRCTGAFLGFAGIVALTHRGWGPPSSRDLAFLGAFGLVIGFGIQLFAFAAIRRLPIGVALLILFTSPFLVAIWTRFIRKEEVRKRVWVALVITLGGLALVVDVGSGSSLNRTGVMLAVFAAVAFAVYILMADHAVSRRDPVSLLFYGFLFASIYWAAIQPWWNFPTDVLLQQHSLGGTLEHWRVPLWMLMLWVIVLGTIIPFALLVGSLQHLSPVRAAVLQTLEPVFAVVVAFVWLKESLSFQQLVGGFIVIGGIVLAQSARYESLLKAANGPRGKEPAAPTDVV